MEPPPDDWKTKARQARNVFEQAPQGEREATLRGLTGDADVNTLRRAVFAVTYLDGLKHKHPDENGILSEAPLSIVEILARWNVFDAEAALDAARRWGTARQSVRALSEEMQRSRKERGAPPSARSLEFEYRRRMIEPAEALVAKLVGGTLTRPSIKHRGPDGETVDYHFLSVTNQQVVSTVAVLIVGPYRNSGLYRKARQQWMWRAFGAAWIYDHVVLLLPDNSEIEAYRQRITAMTHAAAGASPYRDIADTMLIARSTRQPRVHVVSPLDAAEDAAIEKLGRRT